MDYIRTNGFLLEPGPAAFYLPADESKNGVEQELFKFNFSSNVLSDSLEHALCTSQYSLSNEEPLDIEISLDDLKAEGIDLDQLIRVDYDKNGTPIYSSFADENDEDFECQDNQHYGQRIEDRRLNLNTPKRTGPLSKPEETTSKFKKKYACPKCNGKVLVGLEKVLVHMLKSHCGSDSHTSKTYLCSLCDSVLSTESSLKKHIRNVHFRMEAFECPVCKKQIQQRSHLRRHIEKIHGGRKALKKVLKQVRDIVKQNRSFFQDKISSRAINDVESQSLLINNKAANCSEPLTTTSQNSLLNSKSTEDDLGGLFDETQQCPTCGILCTSKAHLALHVKDRHNMGINQLLKILKVSKNESTQELDDTEHFQEDTSSHKSLYLDGKLANPNVCPICGKVSTNVESLSGHVSKVHRYLTQYKCSYCFASNKHTELQNLFFSQAVLDAHIEDVHNEGALPQGEEYKCENCKSAKFAIFHSTSSTEMLDHVLSSHSYGCARCSKHFSTTGGLRYHYKKAHFTDFSENDDKKSMKSEKQVKKKYVSHESISNINSDVETETEHNKTLECSVNTGDEALTTPQHSILSSTATINSEDKAINPQILSQIRLDVNKIVKRIESSGGNLKSIPCDFCRSTETHENEASLLHHICTEHPYRCIYCPEKMVKLPTSMRKHFRKYHRDETPYFCRFCTAVFICQGDANQHALTSHSGEKSTLYRTTNASSGIPPLKIVSPETSKTSLVVDESAHNTSGVKESGSGVCVVCEKDFGDLRNLSDHVQETHNYICEVCNREYKLADSIRKHCRKDHADYYEEPIVCCRFCPTIFHNIPAKQDHIATVHGIRMSGGKYLPPQNAASTTGNDGSLMLNGVPQPPLANVKFQDTTPGASTPTNDNLSNAEAGPIYKCPHCPKGYDITDSLRKHAKNAHDVALGFCRDCKLVFPSHEEKNEHNKNVHNPSDTSMQDSPSIGYVPVSPIPQAKPKQTSILTYLSPNSTAQNHVQASPSASDNAPLIIGMAKSGYGEVTAEDAYQCPKCPKIYAIAKSLRKHCRKVHDELSICFCSSCTNVFVSHEERDHHVSNGQCKGFKGSTENVAVGTSSVSDGNVSTDLDGTPYMGTRKRRISSRNETNHPSIPAETPLASDSPTTRLRRTSSTLHPTSSTVLTQLRTLDPKNNGLETNVKLSLPSKVPKIASISPSPSPLAVASNRPGRLNSSTLQLSSTISKSSTVITSLATGKPSPSSSSNTNIELNTHKPKLFQCDFCEVPAFVSKSSLEEHWLDFHPFGCTLCAKRYKLASSIRRHLHEAHNKKEVFVCHTCTLPFFSFSDKQKHLPKCHPILPRKIQSSPDADNLQIQGRLSSTDEAKQNMQTKLGSPRNESSSKQVKNELTVEAHIKPSLRKRGSSETQKNTDDEHVFTETPVKQKRPGYTITLPLSPLNFHGFKKPSPELEIVNGLEEFRDGLNAYAKEFFIGNTVFDRNLFETSVVTDVIINEQNEMEVKGSGGLPEEMSEVVENT